MGCIPVGCITSIICYDYVNCPVSQGACADCYRYFIIGPGCHGLRDTCPRAVCCGVQLHRSRALNRPKVTPEYDYIRFCVIYVGTYIAAHYRGQSRVPKGHKPCLLCCFKRSASCFIDRNPVKRLYPDHLNTGNSACYSYFHTDSRLSTRQCSITGVRYTAYRYTCCSAAIGRELIVKVPWNHWIRRNVCVHSLAEGNIHIAVVRRKRPAGYAERLHLFPTDTYRTGSIQLVIV